MVSKENLGNSVKLDQNVLKAVLDRNGGAIIMTIYVGFMLNVTYCAIGILRNGQSLSHTVWEKIMKLNDITSAGIHCHLICVEVVSLVLVNKDNKCQCQLEGGCEDWCLNFIYYFES